MRVGGPWSLGYFNTSGLCRSATRLQRCAARTELRRRSSTVRGRDPRPPADPRPQPVLLARGSRRRRSCSPSSARRSPPTTTSPSSPGTSTGTTLPAEESETACGSSGCGRPPTTARSSTSARGQLRELPRRHGAHGPAGPAARPRPLHDRPAGGRRHRAPRRAALRRAAPRDQPGRLPGDRRAGQAARAAARARRAAAARRALPASGRPRRRDRRHDEAAPRGEGRAAGADRGDPELGRHARAPAAAARTTPGRASTASTIRSSSCTRGTSGTRRISTRSSAPRRSSATSSELQIIVIGFGARHRELTALAERLEVTDAVRFLGYQPRRRLSLSLATADLHYVGLARGLSGLVVPSRRLRHPRRRPAGARLRGCGQRDRQARRGGRLRARRAARAGPSSSRA